MRDFDPDKPILSWRIFDKVEISKEKKLKVFYNSNKKFTSMELKRLEPVIKALRDKWADTLNREFFQKVEKTHFEVAGGNHTYFFVLPWMLKFFQKKYPHLNVRLTLFEPRGSADLSYSSADVIYTAAYKDPKTGKLISKVKLLGYFSFKSLSVEKIYFGASLESVRQFGTKKNTLMNHYLIYGKGYTTNDRTGEEIQYPYATIPEKRKKDKRRVLMEQQYLTHIFMKHGVGLYLLFRTMIKDDGVSKLDETPVSLMERYFVYKKSSKDVQKKASFVKKTVVSLLKNRKKT